MTYEDKDFLDRLEKKYNVVIDDLYSDLVHFQTSDDIPFQRWYPYREGYSYKLVDSFIERFNVTGVLLDPFVGSGSSMLAGRYNKLTTYGIDVNPISIFVSSVQNGNYDISTISKIKKELARFSLLDKDSKIRSTNFKLSERYFNSEILQGILQIKEDINSINDVDVRNIFFLSLLSIIEEVSNVKKEGNGLKYRNRKRTTDGYINIPKEIWEKKNFPRDKFSFLQVKIVDKILKILEDLDYNIPDAPEPILILGSSTEEVLSIPEEIELTVFSPPYVNFFDYFEIHKMELWLGDFISSQDDLRQLKKTGIRSNASSTVSKKVIYSNKSVEHLTDLIATKDLWSNKIPEVIIGYFDDMEILLDNLHIKTKPGGRVVIVVGNSAYGGILIPTDLLIAEIAENKGYVVEEIIIARHLTTSPQQRKHLVNVMNYMRESIVVLRKENKN